MIIIKKLDADEETWLLFKPQTLKEKICCKNCFLDKTCVEVVFE